MQPAFHRERIAGYAATMVELRRPACAQSWRDGDDARRRAQEMNRLTLSIVGKTLFDADVESQAREVGEALTGVMESFWMLMLPFADVLERLPLPQLRRGRTGARAARRDHLRHDRASAARSGGDRGDLLSMLLLAQDEEDDGRGMTDEQVRDEAMTIFLAGHETTANALTWTWYLLSAAPDGRARGCTRKSIACCGGRLPTVARSRRRCPTSSGSSPSRCGCIRRRGSSAAARSSAYPIGGYVAPARSILVMSP